VTTILSVHPPGEQLVTVFVRSGRVVDNTEICQEIDRGPDSFRMGGIDSRHGRLQRRV